MSLYRGFGTEFLSSLGPSSVLVDLKTFRALSKTRRSDPRSLPNSVFYNPGTYGGRRISSPQSENQSGVSNRIIGRQRGQKIAYRSTTSLEVYHIDPLSRSDRRNPSFPSNDYYAPAEPLKSIGCELDSKGAIVVQRCGDLPQSSLQRNNHDGCICGQPSLIYRVRVFT
jgi:hypothetical protein